MSDPTRVDMASLYASRWQLLLARLALPESATVDQVISFLAERDGESDRVRDQRAHQWNELCELVGVGVDCSPRFLIRCVLRPRGIA